MIIQPITNTIDLRVYHESVSEMAKSWTKATYQSISKGIRERLQHLWIDKSLVMIIGSDARWESPIFLRQRSPGELIVTAETSDILPGKSLNEIEEDLQSQGFKVDEFKWSDDIRMFYRWNPKVVFPTRIFDAVIAENFEPSPSERAILFEELKKYTKSTIDRFTSKVPEAREAMRSGQSKIWWEFRREIDFDENLFHYDKAQFQNGVKTGPLRFVQYGLMKFIINRVRNGKSWEVDLMLPSNIFSRINTLSSSWILPLSSQETEDLKFIYGYLLYLHHMIQLGSIESNGQTVFEIEGDDMKDIQEMFLNLDAIMAKLKW